MDYRKDHQRMSAAKHASVRCPYSRGVYPARLFRGHNRAWRLRALARSFASPPLALFQLLKDCRPLLRAVCVEPFAPALEVAELQQIFRRPQGRARDVGTFIIDD